MSPDNVAKSGEFYYLKGGKYKQFYPEDNVIVSKTIESFSMDLVKLKNSLNPFGQ